MIEEGNTSSATELHEVRTGPRLVIAAVRPGRPNPAVIRAAADLAQQQGAALLVMGTLRTLLIDCTQAVHFRSLLLEAAAAELFADAVELLYDRQLSWGVDVVLDHPARHINQLARSCDVRAVVTGHSSRRRQWWRKVRDQPTFVVTA